MSQQPFIYPSVQQPAPHQPSAQPQGRAMYAQPHTLSGQAHQFSPTYNQGYQSSQINFGPRPVQPYPVQPQQQPIQVVYTTAPSYSTAPSKVLKMLVPPYQIVQRFPPNTPYGQDMPGQVRPTIGRTLPTLPSLPYGHQPGMTPQGVNPPPRIGPSPVIQQYQAQAAGQPLSRTPPTAGPAATYVPMATHASEPVMDAPAAPPPPSRIKVTLKDPNTLQEVTPAQVVLSNYPRHGSASGVPTPATPTAVAAAKQTAHSAPSGQSAPRSGSMLRGDAVEFKPSFKPSSVEVKPSLGPNSASGPVKPAQHGLAKKSVLNSQAKEFPWPNPAAQAPVAQQEPVLPKESVVTPAPVVKPEVQEAAPVTAALPSQVPSTVHPAPAASPPRVRSRSSRSPSPVTTGASTQESLTSQDPVQQPLCSETDGGGDSSGVSTTPVKDAKAATAAHVEPSGSPQAVLADPKTDSEAPSSTQASPKPERAEPVSDSEAASASSSAAAINYDNEDQWRPTKRDGDKTYSRDFLYQFKGHKSKPTNLLEIEGITVNLHLTSHMSGGGGGGGGGGARRTSRAGNGREAHNNFLPAYARGGSGQSDARGDDRRDGRRDGGGRRDSRPMHRGSQGGNDDRDRRPVRQIVLASDMVEQAPLGGSANRWTRQKDRKSTDMSGEEKLTADTLRSVRGILNKITPEKYAKLLAQLQELPIDSEDRLVGTIDLIFEKALMEKGFCKCYASVCNAMLPLKVPANQGGGKVEFRKILLNSCQRVFEKDDVTRASVYQVYEDVRKRAKEEPDNKALAAEVAEADEAMQKTTRRIVGNIHFIGELFAQQILTEAIMHSCVVKLLGKSSSEESLTCLWALMRSVGKKLDRPEAKTRMDNYFTQIQKLINGKKLINRIRFKMEELVQLRAHNWAPRNVDNAPKTIEEIHREAKAEELRKMESHAAAAPGPRHRNDRDRDRGSGPRGRNSHGRDSGEFSTPSRPSRVCVDSERFRSTTQKVAQHQTTSDIQLGPGGKSWSRGSLGGASSAAASAASRDDRLSNRFSGLAVAPEPPRSIRSGRPEPRSSGPPHRASGSRDQSAGVGSGKAQQARERQEAVSLVRKSGSTPDGSHTGSLGAAPTATSAAVGRSPDGASDKHGEDVVRSKSKETLKEFLSARDVKEVALCIEELKSPGQLGTVVEEFVMNIIDMKATEQVAIGCMVCELVTAAEPALKAQHICDGMKAFLPEASDMEMDVPQLWQYIGNFLAPVVCVHPEIVKTVSDYPLLEEIGRRAKFVAEVLKAILRSGKTPDELKKIWVRCNLSWAKLLPTSENEIKFLEKAGLSYLGCAQPFAPVAELLKSNPTNDAIFSLIEKCVSPEDRQGKSFISGLTVALAESCIVKEVAGGAIAPIYKLDKSALTARGKVFIKYLDTSQDRQLYALLALEEVARKLEHPVDLLHDIFDTLFDDRQCDAIEEESVVKWEALSGDDIPQHGLAVRSVQQFLNFIHRKA